MEKLMCSVAASACLLALSAGVAFATDLHGMPATNALPTPPATTGTAPGQVGSNSGIANCGGTGLGAGMTPGKSSSNNGSPFSSTGRAGAVYAGNPGTKSAANHPGPTGNSVAQYDVACAQQQLH
jgi:hypothetical protein